MNKNVSGKVFVTFGKLIRLFFSFFIIDMQFWKQHIFFYNPNKRTVTIHVVYQNSLVEGAANGRDEKSNKIWTNWTKEFLL